MADTNKLTKGETMYKVIGVNDEQNSCCCCGKTGLKRVVWLKNVDTDDVAHYGTTCAKALVSASSVNKAVDACKTLDAAKAYASKWLAKTPSHTAKLIADALYHGPSSRFDRAVALGDYSLRMSDGSVITQN